jgi:hypothetical protein
MRWFVVFLLLANLVLYLWVAYGESPRPAHDLPPPDIGRLRLLHEAEPAGQAELAIPGDPVTEMSPGQPRLLETGPGEGGRDTGYAAAEPAEAGDEMSLPIARSAPPPAVDTVPAVRPMVESAGLSDGPATAVRQTPSANTVDEPAGETTLATQVVESAPLERSLAVPEPVVAIAPAARLQDVPEVSAGSRAVEPLPLLGTPADTEPVAEPAAPVVSEAAVNRCLRIGPLTIEEAQAFRANMAAAVRVVDEERRDVAVVDGYYVLIPPLASRQEGNRKLDELSAAGVKDTWLFRSGELRNAISLGYFKREASALRHADTIRRLGFDAEVREKPVQVERLWLLLSRPGTFDPAVVKGQAPGSALAEAADCPAP